MDLTFQTIAINILISVLVIYFIHNMWNYLRDTYTVKKTKDLVDFQTKKYREMLADMHPAESSPDMSSDFMSEEDKQWMIQELKGFISSIPAQ